MNKDKINRIHSIFSRMQNDEEISNDDRIFFQDNNHLLENQVNMDVVQEQKVTDDDIVGPSALNVNMNIDEHTNVNGTLHNVPLTNIHHQQQDSIADDTNSLLIEDDSKMNNISIEELLLEKNVKSLLHFFNNENQIFAHDEKYLLYIIGRDSKGILYIRLFRNTEEIEKIDDHLMFIKVNVEALNQVLMDRTHVKSILNHYNNEFIQIGYLKTNLFNKFHMILVDYRIVYDMVIQGWLRFKAFSNFKSLAFCEQAFFVAILNRDCNEPYQRWAILNPKSSSLVHSLNYIGIYGVTGINQSSRIKVNKIFAEKIYNKSINLIDKTKLTSLTNNLFGPIDIRLEIKLQIINDHDLLNKFIEIFQPHLLDFNSSELNDKLWKVDNIFGDKNDILVDGKIYGIIVNIKNFYEMTSEEIKKYIDKKDITLLSSKKYIYKKLLTYNKPGELFIPIIPTNTMKNGFVQFKYPEYYIDNSLFELPDINNVNNRKTNIYVLDIFNFIIGFFMSSYDYLSIISKYVDNGQKNIHYPNIISYNIPFDNTEEESIRCTNYSWVQVKTSSHKNICPIPVITLTLLNNSLKYPCGIPIHLKKFFDYKLKLDMLGILTMSGVNYTRNLNMLDFSDINSHQRHNNSSYKNIETQLKNYLDNSIITNNKFTLLCIDECDQQSAALISLKLKLELKNESVQEQEDILDNNNGDEIESCYDDGYDSDYSSVLGDEEEEEEEDLLSVGIGDILNNNSKDSTKDESNNNLLSITIEDCDISSNFKDYNINSYNKKSPTQQQNMINDFVLYDLYRLIEIWQKEDPENRNGKCPPVNYSPEDSRNIYQFVYRIKSGNFEAITKEQKVYLSQLLDDFKDVDDPLLVTNSNKISSPQDMSNIMLMDNELIKNYIIDNILKIYNKDGVKLSFLLEQMKKIEDYNNLVGNINSSNYKNYIVNCVLEPMKEKNLIFVEDNNDDENDPLIILFDE